MFNSFQGSCVTTLTNGGKSKDRVIINVGGTRHECYISTIQNFPDTRLYWIAETALKMADFDPEGNEFFFDRHPQCFTNILNYCRTGKLHCPNDVCGPLFEQELAFWGVDELMMEPCCWGTFTQHRDAHKNLSMFDEMHLNAQDNPEEEFDDEFDEDDVTSALTQNKKRCRGNRRKNLWAKLLASRPTLWSILEKPFSSVYAQVSAFISLVIILMSLTTFCAETVEYFKDEKRVFEKLEYFYCGFFTFELLLRLWCCPSKKKYFKSMMTWIDIISTAQFYISFATDQSTFDFLFVTRLLRVFRLFRFFKNLSGMQVIAQTLKASANELLLLCIIVFIPMVIFSTMVFYAEFGQTSNPFSSIPGTFWWTIITMTTVGYGDVTPKSLPGKIIGAFTACSGVLIVALPVSVIGSNFSLYYSYAQARMRLPKRKSPALVSADKALIPSGETNKTEKEDQNTETLGFSLKNFANVVIDIAGVNRSSPTSETPTCSPPPSLNGLQRQRSSRRDAIQPRNNPINSPCKDKDKTKGSRNRKVSKCTPTEKISEEVAPADINLTNNNIVSATTDSNDQVICRQRLNNNNNKKCQRRSLPAIENNSMMNGTIADSCLDYIDGGDSNTNGHYRSRKHTRSLSEIDSSTISPQTRRRNIIHCDNELLRYRPKRLSVAEQKIRRKVTTVPNFHNAPFELNSISEQSATTHNEDDNSVIPPWMRAASLVRSPPANQESLLLER